MNLTILKIWLWIKGVILNIKELIKEAHDYSKSHGFYDCFECKGKKTMFYEWSNGIAVYCNRCNGSGIDPTIKKLVHDKLEEELLEFANSYPSKTFDKDSEQSEISDIILVLLAYCGEMGYDIEQDIIAKMAYNRTREHKHNKEY